VPIEPEQLKHIALNNDWDESLHRCHGTEKRSTC
jgi:hypothetical protein